jgi:hypothetical protein
VDPGGEIHHGNATPGNVPDRGTCTETAVAASLTLSLQQFIKLAYPPGLSMSTEALNGAFTIGDCRGSVAFEHVFLALILHLPACLQLFVCL